jgi:curli biogenesis system outer membrane secretion channel CsgG
LINESTAVRLGNLVGAKYILLGSLTQYSPIYQADFSTFSKSYYQKVEISLDARIVDVETGMVASSARGRGQWEKTRSKWEKSTIYDREPGAGDVEPDVINSSLRNAVNDLVNNLTRAFAR